MNLFQITNEMQSIMNELIENGGELTPELESMLMITESQLKEKAVNYAMVIRSMDYETNVIDEEIKRLQALKKTRQNAIERLKSALTNAMQQCDMDAIETPTNKISFRKSQSLEILDETLVPKQYKTQVITTKIDKNAIKQDIKNGITVHGVELLTNKNLQIK